MRRNLGAWRPRLSLFRIVLREADLNSTFNILVVVILPWKNNWDKVSFSKNDPLFNVPK